MKDGEQYIVIKKKLEIIAIPGMENLFKNSHINSRKINETKL